MSVLREGENLPEGKAQRKLETGQNTKDEEKNNNWEDISMLETNLKL